MLNINNCSKFKLSKLTIFLLFIIGVISMSKVLANDNFEAIVTIRETTLDNKLLTTEKYNILLKNNTIDKNLKYKSVFEKIMTRIKHFENKYDGEDLFFVEMVKETDNKEWTISIEVKDSDISVTHFISKYDDKIIDGWINRNNTDIFGLRIFNF